MSNRVLLISATDDIAAIIQDVIKSLGHTPLLATTLEEAMAMTAASPVDLVLLDTISDRLDDQETLSMLATQLSVELTPVLALSASIVNVDELSEQMGNIRFFDFVTSPFARHDLEARISAALRTKKFQDRLRRATTLDPATSMLNRVSAEKRLTEEISRAVRYGRSLACVLAIIEPEPAEDIVQEIGRLFTENTRLSDVMCRWDRNMILMILPETGPFGAARVAENLRKHCASLSLAAAQVGSPQFMTFYGAAGFIEGDNCETLIARVSDAAAEALKSPDSPVVLARITPRSGDIRFLRI